jgi:hypothetical protein
MCVFIYGQRVPKKHKKMYIYRRLWYAPSACIIICGIIITCNESSKIIVIYIITIRTNETSPRRKMLFDVRVHINIIYVQLVLSSSLLYFHCWKYNKIYHYYIKCIDKLRSFHVECVDFWSKKIIQTLYSKFKSMALLSRVYNWQQLCEVAKIGLPIPNSALVYHE